MQSRMRGEWFFKLHMLHMALGVGEGGGWRFACLARRQLTAQLDIVEHSEPPCLAACHFGIVSAIESLFNLSLSLKALDRPSVQLFHQGTDRLFF